MINEKSPRYDHDMQSATAALIRASQKARQLAAQTGTEFIYMRDGKLVREMPELKKPAALEQSKQDEV